MLIVRNADAEIIAPDEVVNVFIRRSPLRQQREHIKVAAGLSIEEIIACCGLEPARLHVSISGHVIEHRNWARVRAKPGVSVVIVKVPGKGALRAIAGLVVALVAAVAAPWLVGALLPGLTGTAAAVATGLIGAGISLAGSLIINALFPVAKPDSLPQTKPLYSIGGGQNTAAQYGAIPEIFGVHRISPPKAAGDYTELVGDDQYLRMLFVVGYSPISVSELKIGETDINKFEDLTYEVITDHTVTPITLYTKPVFQEDVSVVLDAPTGWVQRTTADDIDEISVDVSAPNGVYRVKAKDGSRINYTVTVAVQYKLSSSAAWLTLGTIDLTSNSPQAVRRSLAISVARGKYDVRVSKSSPDYAGGNDTVSETVYWTAVRGRRNEPVINFSKPLTLIAMRIRATGQLNGTVNTFNCIASPKIRSWSGTSWVPGQVTRTPADHFRQVLQGNGNARPVSDAMIDIESLQDWHAYCKSNGFTFDFVASEQLSVYDRLTQIAAAGRAAVSNRDGRWGVVWDIENSPIVQHFTPRNSSNFSSVRAFADIPHAFRVKFINRENGYLNDERIVYDDGYTKANATKFEGIEFPGVTFTDLIWKHGRYHIAQLRLQRETYTLDSDFEHLVCTRGDRVRVNHDVVLWGAGAARVKSVSASPAGVVLDDLLTMQSGKTYSMRFRRPDGSSIVRSIVGLDGEFSTFEFSDTGALPAPGDLAQFGELGFESVVLRVKSINARQDLSAQIELVDDAPAIMQADKGAIPPFQTGIAPIPDYRASAPYGLTYAETIWTTNPATSEVDLVWQAPNVGAASSYIVQFRRSGDDVWITVPSVSAPAAKLVDLAAGVYDVRVRAIFANGDLSGFLTGSFVCAIFASNPSDVSDFRVAISGDVAMLQWDAQTDQAVSHFEIRFSPALSGVTWQAASQLRERVLGAQAQVPAMVGTYLIKAVSFAGLMSVNAALIVSSVNPLTAFNAVEMLDEAPAFAGSKDGVIEVGGELRLDTATDLFALVDWFSVEDYFLSLGGFLSEGVYDFADIIDLGEVYTSRVSASISAFGVVASLDLFNRADWFDVPDYFGLASDALWNVRVEVSSTTDDPSGSPAWSDWAQLVTSDVSARAYRFRARLISYQFDVTPAVQGLSVTVDMPDRVIAENDLVVTTSGRSISFSPPYYELSGVSIAAQNMLTGDYYEITGKTNAGFTIIFKNASGTPVSRTFDYVAKGYGYVQ